jgi:hypothetical protein
MAQKAGTTKPIPNALAAERVTRLLLTDWADVAIPLFMQHLGSRKTRHKICCLWCREAIPKSVFDNSHRG